MLLKSLTVLSLSALSIAHTIPPADQHPSYSIPSVHDSAVLARRIVNLSKIGTLSTVFQPLARSQDDNNYDEEAISDNLVGIPIGLPDYFADCNPDSDNGNPTILAIDIATPFRNVRAGSNISLAVEWVPPFPPSKRISLWSRVASLFYAAPISDDGNEDTPDTVPYSAANLPRFSLIGYLEPLDSEATEDGKVAECFVAKHPDAQYWLPGNRIHRSRWARLVVTHIYWVGGFGDRAYIGWIPAQEYNSVGRDEWKAVRLPGEKPGWNEWAVGDL